MTKTKNPLKISLAANGRFVLPAYVRDSLGAAGGGSLELIQTEDGYLLRAPTDRCCVCGATKNLCYIGFAGKKEKQALCQTCICEIKSFDNTTKGE